MKNIKNILLILIVSIIGMGAAELLNKTFEKELLNMDNNVNNHLEYVESISKK
jgi:hypothetical protein